jgi:HAD superfamily hydrolase (TIGR01459 family)
MLPAQKNAPDYIEGLGEIIKHYDCLIMDIWGVLHNGVTLYEHTLATLHSLQDKNRQICLLSNTGQRSETIISHLETMGISRSLYAHILTAGESAHMGLPEYIKTYGPNCLYIKDELAVEDKKDRLVEGLDIHFVDSAEQADFILNACGGTPPDKVTELEKRIEKIAAFKKPMICANPDIVVEVGGKIFPCAGHFSQLYQSHGGKVIYHGKPHLPVYEQAQKLLGMPDKSRIIAIGDSLHTDIQGAKVFDIDVIWNMCGIHQKELGSGETQIDHHLKDLKYRPDYVMSELKF